MRGATRAVAADPRPRPGRAQVARIVAAREALGAERDAFFVSLGGFDSHSDLDETLPEKFAQSAPRRRRLRVPRPLPRALARRAGTPTRHALAPRRCAAPRPVPLTRPRRRRRAALSRRRTA